MLSMNSQDGSIKMVWKGKDIIQSVETPDTKELMFLQWDNKIKAWNVKVLSKSDRKTRTIFELPPRTYVPIAFSRDTKSIMYSKEQHSNRIMVIDNLY